MCRQTEAISINFSNGYVPAAQNKATIGSRPQHLFPKAVLLKVTAPRVAKKGEGVRSTNRWLQRSHGDVQCRVGNTVSNTGPSALSGGHRTYVGGHFVIYINVESLLHSKLI